MLRSLVDQLRQILTADADDPASAGSSRPRIPTTKTATRSTSGSSTTTCKGDGSPRSRSSRTRLDAERVDAEQLAAWMGAVNDIRLVIGTSLDVSEDPSFEITDDDPDVQAYAIYTYCSWLLEQIVEALNP